MQSSRPRQPIRTQLQILVTLLLLIWGLEIADFLSGNALDQFGIVPRTADGLRGIVFAPWLHFGFEHLAANTLPLLALAWLSMLRGLRTFLQVTLIVILVGGLGTWLIGEPNSVHLGASLLIFGYFAFLLFGGIFERSTQAIALMLIVVILYGSLIWGILPVRVENISWEGHLSGFVGGLLAARLLRQPRRAPEPEPEPADDDFEDYQSLQDAIRIRTDDFPRNS